MLTLKCPHCGASNSYDPSEVYLELAEGYVYCYNCIRTITIVTEGVTVEDRGRDTCSEPILPVLEEGEIVVITNEEHPWNGELALICGIKHKHYRIEIFGCKLWVPFDWVKQIDDSS